MPIIGETSKVVNRDVTRGMVRLGKIWKGDPRPADGKRPGPERPWYRFAFPEETPEQVEMAQRVLYPAVRKLYGEHPMKIDGVYLIDDEVDQAFATWYEQRGQSGMSIRCDGEQRIMQRNEAGRMIAFERFDQPCPPCLSPDKEKPECGCVRVGRLRFVLQGVLNATGLFGFFEMETHSFNDRAHLHNFLVDLQYRAGRITGIPLMLKRMPREFTVQVKGKNSAVTKHMVTITVDPAFVKRILAGRLTDGAWDNGLMSAPGRAALPARVDSDGVLHDDPEPVGDPDGEYDPDELNDWGAPDEVEMPETQPETEPEPETAIHWSNDPSHMLTLRGIVEQEKLPPLETFQSSWSEFPTGKSIVDKLRQLKKTNASSTDSMRAGGGLGVVDLGRLCDAFNVSETEMMAIMDVEDWFELGTNAEARAKILGRALDRNWPVVATKCLYQSDPRCIQFDTVLGTITWYKGRKELRAYAEGLGLEGTDWDAVPSWNQGIHVLPHNLMVIWHKAEQTGRLDALRFVLPK